eukprot:Em0001g563a
MVKDVVENHKHDPHLKDENGDTALNVAACSGKLETLKYLIEECNCSPVCLGRDDRTPLHNACQDNGNLHVVRYLMEKHNCHHSVKDKHGDTPLNVAALSGHLDIVTYFIEEKHCTSECPGQWGQSPLHNVCRKSPSINVVVENHACDPSKKDDRGDTTLNAAGSLDILQYFIDTKKFSAKAQDKNGNLPLSAAVHFYNLSVLKYFLEEKKCDPRIHASWNRSLLYIASIIGNLHVVKYLVEEQGVGCDFHYKDTNGFIPLDGATSANITSVITYLKERITLPPCQPETVQVQDEKTRIWIPQTLSGTPVEWVQWNPEMRTLAGPTSSVRIIEVSFIQGESLASDLANRLSKVADVPVASENVQVTNKRTSGPGASPQTRQCRPGAKRLTPEHPGRRPSSSYKADPEKKKASVRDSFLLLRFQYKVLLVHTQKRIGQRFMKFCHCFARNGFYGKVYKLRGIVCKVKDGYLIPSLLKGLEAEDLEQLLSKHPDSVAVCYKDRWSSKEKQSKVVCSTDDGLVEQVAKEYNTMDQIHQVFGIVELAEEVVAGGPKTCHQPGEWLDDVRPLKPRMLEQRSPNASKRAHSANNPDVTVDIVISWAKWRADALRVAVRLRSTEGEQSSPS